MTARILVITNGHLCRNPRALKEADCLARAGHDVTILYVRNHAPSDPVDDALAAQAPYRRETVNLLPGGGPKAFRQRVLVWFARQRVTRLGSQSLQALGPAAALRSRAAAIGADLTIVHNEVAHGVGIQLHAKGYRVAADIEDWHTEDLLPADRRHRPMERLRQQEERLLNQLAYTTTTSDALADGLQARYGGTRPRVITNSFPLQSDPRTTRASTDRPPAFFWFSQRLGPGRGLEAFATAWARTTHPSRLVLLGEPSPGYRDALRSALPPDRRERLEFLDLVPPHLLPGVIAAHDIGLAMERADLLSRNLTITNKILQYLNAGLALVASNTAGQREVLAHDPMAGVTVDLEDPTGFARALDQLLANPDVLSRHQRAARQLAERVYCWEHEAPRLIQLVETVLQPASVMSRR